MNIEDLAGQRLMAGYDGTTLNDQLKEYIREYRVGGLIFFARNLIEPKQIEQLCRDSQAYAKDQGLPPLLIAVDQEGGPVARLKPPYTQFAGNPGIKSEEDAQEYARVMAKELLEAGFNMNMAPVMDVVPPDFDSIMIGRAFEGGPEEVARLGGYVIQYLQEYGILAVAKHFPGIGRTTLDSHLELPYSHTPRAQLEAEDLVPFQEAVKKQASGVMFSHILYTDLDPDWPASISPAIVSLLREDMGYTGIIMTDDLDMGAVAKQFPIETVIEQFMKSGSDLALICHPGPNIKTAFNIIRKGLESDPNLLAMGRASVQRMLAAKQGI
ncbi:beta-N-acetylhexosaminidase [Desulfatibacillum alkenivorans DSM 16219]|jgi:beta-N-acetylhexosaminidase|uniref:beta-N-acetylhexosaminidase n=1 Tax=Desulfatibacillum alkenivorans DSM 16219 TaxID=1121393 RepID=A0A1M6Z0H9_9BACT|nr:glycoside hydrolase family 3 N-terminal domain-containing protein [Desulfatibacillum alkenivorans]SHL23883.1 beta-N-acetylhexosaminidase [Desulfatibacillum alkenivorans DSM 16219]